jgi:Big-like domain-containing protein
LRDRLRTIFIALVATTATVAAPLAAHGSVAPPKVVIIVGPTGSYTDNYRSQGDDIAAAASADGANVVKVYSPNATWSKVRAAVAGAKIIVYLGHGNGYPNPYGSTFYPDRTDGWGLNRTTTHGDGDDWSTTMVYCGEKALLGTLTSSDGSAQWSYCGGSTNTDGIAPAAGFVMVYSNACYAPGANEPQNPDATATVALKHVSYYSRPVLAGLGASGYFATDHGAATLVGAILSNPDTSYGNLYLDNLPNGDPLDYPHYLLSGTRAWLTHTSDYTYAFAGNPGRTFNGGTAPYDSPPSASSLPSVTGFAPASGATGVGMTPSVRVTFSEPVSNVSSSTVVLWDAVTWKVVGATVALDSSATVATLRPKNPLQPKHRYAVRVSSWIVDADNNQLTYASMLFTTTLTQIYSPTRSLTFTAGLHTGHKFSSTGAILATRAYTLARSSGAPTSKRSGITGRSGGWYYVTAGVWAGYWMKEGSGITLQ